LANKVNREALQEYRFPIPNGNLYYSKNPFGEVTVKFAVSSSTIKQGDILGTMPTGFRPMRMYEVPFISTAGGKGVGTVYFQPNGDIEVISAPVQGATYIVSTTVVYVAAQ